MMSGEGESREQISQGTGGEEGPEPELKKLRWDEEDCMEVEQRVQMKVVELVDLAGDDEEEQVDGGTSPTESQPEPSSAAIPNGGNYVRVKTEPGQDQNLVDDIGSGSEKNWQKVAELNGKITNLGTQLEDRERKIKFLNEELDLKNKKVGELHLELEKERQQVQLSEKEVKERNKEVRRLEEVSKEKSKKIRCLERKAEEAKNQIIRLDAEVEKKNSEIQRLEAQVEEKTMENLDLEKKEGIQRLKAEALQNLVKENVELKTENEQLKDKLGLTADYLKKRVEEMGKEADSLNKKMEEMVKATAFLQGKEENEGTAAEPPSTSEITRTPSMPNLVEEQVSTSAEPEPTSDIPSPQGPKRERIEQMQTLSGQGPGPSLQQYANFNDLSGNEDPDLFILHHEDMTKEGEHGCTCGKTYSLKTTLRLHIQSSNEKWKFKCDECEGGFFLYCRFRMHMEQKHGKKIPWKVGCAKCGNTFKTKKDFNEHKHQCKKTQN